MRLSGAAACRFARSAVPTLYHSSWPSESPAAAVPSEGSAIRVTVTLLDDTSPDQIGRASSLRFVLSYLKTKVYWAGRERSQLRLSSEKVYLWIECGEISCNIKP